ncbi:nucleotidyl transferase AbiEii/AbiGii toxin family protein [Alloscardovia macacae]|uniref:nucleotidyl transferase AbiEii/AbiGii toxin family protein n=1 Tax=Alloscardovia macacae TaxID=1160091 RepID=UPI001C5B6E33|nr:nucleotidyl transferase AbiEii/AbiGii toxin family protein [Alloscardovia macacae]
MSMTAAQIKGRIKTLAKEKNADARVLLRIFMMERFLERIAHSSYGENFVLKGGMLVTNLLGVTMRSTMDIDTTVRGLQLSAEHMKDIVVELCDMKENCYLL